MIKRLLPLFTAADTQLPLSTIDDQYKFSSYEQNNAIFHHTTTDMPLPVLFNILELHGSPSPDIVTVASRGDDKSP